MSVKNFLKVLLLNLAIVMAETRGFIIPKYRARAARPTQSSDVGGYIPCKCFLAMHVKADMWRHQRSCSLNQNGNASKAIGKAKRTIRSAPATTGKLLLPMSMKKKTRDVVLPMKKMSSLLLKWIL